MAAEHLDPSELGTRKYWDDAYVTELSNFENNPSDEGTIWFSDSGAEEKILEYLTEELCLDTTSTSFLDLGTGNGHLLFMLREDGEFNGRMIGVDYSLPSVQLARTIAAQKGHGGGVGQEEDGAGKTGDKEDREGGEEEEDEEGEDAEPITFETWDIIHEQPGEWADKDGGFDVVLDKGTFDAISLSEEVDGSGKRIFEGYKGKVERLVKPGGILFITSCNWTEPELCRWFEGGELEFDGKVNYPSFTFGGHKGQTISSICFRRKKTSS
ncbi:S-adenosyl-L-methionine-dependent methyltransferase [Xylona heveae TC161]|uniref:Protein-lysine N-methyltransferase EFM4 n=1 Tax=Xylona heveae (strain CBS 132557 / TC161) TaxID=1328760 RepID=A0A165GHK6_XYLHT|nr:S-adenosyl-L-methionine-dependent methyltransferase [Xylona heveae TC161]KZF22193.1 S-adenosyl-L-methionine-dependent methyltransferase [Xylona heveae TC161]